MKIVFKRNDWLNYVDFICRYLSHETLLLQIYGMMQVI